jgi:hypothetical protein
MVLWFDRKTRLSGHRCLSSIERDELLSSNDDGGGNMNNVQGATPEHGRMIGRKLLRFLFNGGSKVGRMLPAAYGNILLESGNRPTQSFPCEMPLSEWHS